MMQEEQVGLKGLRHYREVSEWYGSGAGSAHYINTWANMQKKQSCYLSTIYSTTALSATMFCSSPEAPHHLCIKIFNCSVRNAVLKLMHYLSF